MKGAAIFKWVLIFGISLVVVGLLSSLTQLQAVTKVFLISGLCLCAFSFQRFSALRGFSYSTWILASVTVAMFYPELFKGIGDFSFKKLIVPLLQLIMFGVGSTMGVKDFEGVIKMPKGVLAGIICHFTIMPFVGYALTKIFNFPPEISAGIILVGCMPSGLASNVMSYIANANVALSVTVTAVATLLAPLITPFLMQHLAGEYVPVDFFSMMIDISKIVIVPIGAGLIFNKLFSVRFKWLSSVMPQVSVVSIAAIITIITAAGRDSLLQVGLLLILACLIHNLAGYFFGYYSCKLLKMDEKSCRTIALEVGLQNAGLASGLALQMGRVATVGLAPAIFGPLMNITGSSIASWWHNRPTKD